MTLAWNFLTLAWTYHELSLLYLFDDGGNMPVIQLFPREGLKSPKAVLDGVAAIVQGTIVQGTSCPRRLLSKGQLSKQTLVQGDFCPRCELTNIRLLTLFFLIFYDQ